MTPDAPSQSAPAPAPDLPELDIKKTWASRHKLAATLALLGIVAGSWALLQWRPVAELVAQLVDAKSPDDFLTNGVATMRDTLAGYEGWAVVVSTLLMILQAIIAPIPAVAITLTNAALFGPFWGCVLSYLSAQLAAAICYGIGMIWGWPVVLKIVGKEKIEKVEYWFRDFGVQTVVIARLLPFVPFDPISYFAGMLRIGFWRFFIATAIGQLPASIIYSLVGAGLADKQERTVMLSWAVGALLLLTIGGMIWRAKQRKARTSLVESFGVGDSWESPAVAPPDTTAP
jgi:uncharacterized membrane protein YdjX (TVP38/TMEM64 family)